MRDKKLSDDPEYVREFALSIAFNVFVAVLFLVSIKIVAVM